MDEIKQNYSENESTQAQTPEPNVIIKIVYSSSTPAAKRAAKKWRDNNKEQCREMDRNKKYKRYHRDPEYKARVLETNRLNYKKSTEKQQNSCLQQ